MAVDLAKIKNDLANFSSGNFWKPKTGKNYIRILPPWRADIPVYYYAVHLHWVGSRYILCPGSGCIICNMLKDSAFATVLKDKITTMDKFLVNMVDLEDTNAGVQVWGMPVTVWRALNQYFLDPKWGDLTDPTRGRNITLVREGSGARDTKYQVYPDPDPTPLDPSLLEAMKDLSTIFEELPFDKIVELLQNENISVTSGASVPLPQQPKPAIPQQTSTSTTPQTPPLPQGNEVLPANESSSETKAEGKLDLEKMQALLNSLMNK